MSYVFWFNYSRQWFYSEYSLHFTSHIYEVESNFKTSAMNNLLYSLCRVNEYLFFLVSQSDFWPSHVLRPLDYFHTGLGRYFFKTALELANLIRQLSDIFATCSQNWLHSSQLLIASMYLTKITRSFTNFRQ